MLNCKFRSYIKPWWCVLHEKLRFYNNRVILVLKFVFIYSEVVLRLSSNMIVDNKTNFPHKLLLTNRQVANLQKAFANYLLTDIKLLKTPLSKMIQAGGFLGTLLGPLLKAGFTINKKCD